VQLSTRLGHCNISLATLLNLKPGDIVPCDFQGQVTLLAEDVPLFRGSFGLAHGQQAVKIEERVRRISSPTTDQMLAKRA
jgi:flagellar motor switch protein FliM